MTKKHFEAMADYIAQERRAAEAHGAKVVGGHSVYHNEAYGAYKMALYLCNKFSPHYLASPKQLKAQKVYPVPDEYLTDEERTPMQADLKDHVWVTRFDRAKFDAWIEKKARSA